MRYGVSITINFGYRQLFGRNAEFLKADMEQAMIEMAWAVRALCDVVQVFPLGETVETGDAVFVLRQPRFWGDFAVSLAPCVRCDVRLADLQVDEL